MAIQAQIIRNAMDSSIDLYIWEVLPNNRVAIYDPMELRSTVYSDNVPFPSRPTLHIPSNYFRQNSGLLAALAKALNEEGFKPEEESKMAGKLEAVNYHLEDLRTLLHLHERTIEVKK